MQTTNTGQCSHKELKFIFHWKVMNKMENYFLLVPENQRYSCKRSDKFWKMTPDI